MLCAKSRFGHLLILFCKPCPPNLHVFALCVICTGGGLLTPFMMHVAITLWLSYIYVHVATAHQWNEHSLDQLEGIAVATIELSCWLGCALASKSSSSMASCCTGNIIECLLYNARLHWKWWVWNKVCMILSEVCMCDPKIVAQCSDPRFVQHNPYVSESLHCT